MLNSYYSIGPKVLVVLHLFYRDQVSLFVDKLSNIPFCFDCFISVAPYMVGEVVVAFESVAFLRKLQVKVFPNVGRDIAPLLVGYADELLAYDLVLKLHGKKSLHNPQLHDWLNSCLKGLVGSPPIVRHHCATLLRSDIGIISISPPQAIALAIERDGSWGHEARSFYRCARERHRLGFSDALPQSRFDFPVGSMFWCKPEVLQPLVDLNLRWSSFDREAGQLDGTLAHAIERLLGLVCTQKLGLECRTVWPVEDQLLGLIVHD